MNWFITPSKTSSFRFLRMEFPRCGFLLFILVTCFLFSFGSLARDYPPAERLRKLSLHLRGMEPTQGDYHGLTSIAEEDLEVFFASIAKKWVKTVHFKDKAEKNLYEILGNKVKNTTAFSDHNDKVSRGSGQAQPIGTELSLEGGNYSQTILRKILNSEAMSWQEILTSPHYVMRSFTEKVTDEMRDSYYEIFKRANVLQREVNISDQEAFDLAVGGIPFDDAFSEEVARQTFDRIHDILGIDEGDQYDFSPEGTLKLLADVEWYILKGSYEEDFKDKRFFEALSRFFLLPNKKIYIDYVKSRVKYLFTDGYLSRNSYYNCILFADYDYCNYKEEGVTDEVIDKYFANFKSVEGLREFSVRGKQLLGEIYSNIRTYLSKNKKRAQLAVHINWEMFYPGFSDHYTVDLPPLVKYIYNADPELIFSWYEQYSEIGQVKNFDDVAAKFLSEHTFDTREFEKHNKGMYAVSSLINNGIASSEIFEAGSDLTDSSLSEDFRRVFFCDDLMPSSSGGAGNLQSVLDGTQDMNQDVIEIHFQDFAGNTNQLNLTDPSHLLNQTVGTPTFSQCQTQRFWNLVIGKDVPIENEKRNQLAEEFKDHEFSLDQIFLKLVSQPEFYSHEPTKPTSDLGWRRNLAVHQWLNTMIQHFPQTHAYCTNDLRDNGPEGKTMDQWLKDCLLKVISEDIDYALLSRDSGRNFENYRSYGFVELSTALTTNQSETPLEELNWKQFDDGLKESWIEAMIKHTLPHVKFDPDELNGFISDLKVAVDKDIDKPRPKKKSDDINDSGEINISFNADNTSDVDNTGKTADKKDKSNLKVAAYLLKLALLTSDYFKTY